jgi:hypothetical protein
MDRLRSSWSSVYRNEAHVLAFDCLGDRFRIDEVVLVGLHKWLRELGCNTAESRAPASAVLG